MKYIHGIDSLRFFAAFLVLIFHCNDGLRQMDGQLFSTAPILTKGPFAVDYFFVISGFLVSLLAFREMDKKGFFSVRKFLVRRALRIFPLYYLAVFLGFFGLGYLYPHFFGNQFYDFEISQALPYYLFFLPNWVIVEWQNIGPTYMLWSIGVEEQFYLGFPILVYCFLKTTRKEVLTAILLLLYLAFYLSIAIDFWSISQKFDRFIVETLRLHFILTGILIATLFHKEKDHKILRILGHDGVQYASIAGLLGLLFLPNNIDPHNLSGGLLFTIILANLATGRSKWSLKSGIINYLGVISYGIYIFHPFVSIGIRFMMMHLEPLFAVIQQFPVLFYVLVSLATFLVAHISYKYYESVFLRMKRNFY